MPHSYVLLSKKTRFKLSISGIRLTFVDNFRLNADYLVHLKRKWRVWGVGAKRAFNIRFG